MLKAASCVNFLVSAHVPMTAVKHSNWELKFVLWSLQLIDLKTSSKCFHYLYFVDLIWFKASFWFGSECILHCGHTIMWHEASGHSGIIADVTYIQLQ